MTSLSYPSRAHRRFLGLTLPPQLVVHADDFMVPKRFSLAGRAKKAMYEHLSTAGQMRGGILLGHQEAETLHISALLPNGYGVADPYAPDPQYVLGAVEAAQLLADKPLDWIGNWLMPADTILTAEWCDQVWVECRKRALVPLGTAVITFGYTSERVEHIAWADDGEGRSVLTAIPAE